MYGYGITGISPIGFGLGGSAYGDYSNYMPSMMGMGMNGTGMFGMGYGMAPMMEYQQYMTRLQNQLELDSLAHVNQMHKGMINNEVEAHEDSLSGITQKLIADASVQTKIATLYDKIREGDQNGVVQEYDKLKARVYATFDKELGSKGIEIGRADEALRIIESMYFNLITASAGDGQQHTLKGDLEKYCGNAIKTGIECGFRGEDDRRFYDETINHIYGTRIDDHKNKKHQKMLGKGIGTVGSVFRDIFQGAALGAGTWVAGTTSVGLITLLCGGKMKWWPTVTGRGAGFAALAGIAAMGAWDVIKRLDQKAKVENV